MDYILQLGLNRLRKSGSTDPAVRITWLIDQLLEVIAENLSDEDTGRSSFRSQLENLRRDILAVGDGNIPGLTALGTLDLCRGQFRLSHSKRLERDEHFTEIIVFLRKALAGLTGDSRTFHEDLLLTTKRIKGLVELKDIQELKGKIAAEVEALNQAVVEKQRREQVQFTHLTEKILVLQRKLETAKAEASLDGLTGIANRRNFDFTIQRWVIAHEKNEEPFTMAILDLDNFKQINDSYGHQIGDQVLVAAAMELGKNIRGSDYLARYGGEEFIILAAGMKLGESERRFSSLLKKIEGTRFACKSIEKGDLAISVTASCGLAEYALGESALDLIRRADEALYEAKRQGKNRAITKRRPLPGAFYEGRKRA